MPEQCLCRLVFEPGKLAALFHGERREPELVNPTGREIAPAETPAWGARRAYIPRITTRSPGGGAA